VQFLIAMNWKLRSTVVSFVSVDGMVGVARKLNLRSRETRLLAASRPSRLEILRLVAFKLVSVSRSCWVSGPMGLFKASRIAARNRASGIETFCARAEAARQFKTTAAITEKIVRFFIMLV